MGLGLSLGMEKQQHRWRGEHHRAEGLGEAVWFPGGRPIKCRLVSPCQAPEALGIWNSRTFSWDLNTSAAPRHRLDWREDRSHCKDLCPLTGLFYPKTREPSPWAVWCWYCSKWKAEENRSRRMLHSQVPKYSNQINFCLEFTVWKSIAKWSALPDICDASAHMCRGKGSKEKQWQQHLLRKALNQQDAWHMPRVKHVPSSIPNSMALRHGRESPGSWYMPSNAQRGSGYSQFLIKLHLVGKKCSRVLD